MKLTSMEIVRFVEGESSRFIKRYSTKGEFYYSTLFREILGRCNEQIGDDSYYSRNNYYLLAWEIMVKVCSNLHGHLRPDFPHLVIGVDGQGILEPKEGKTIEVHTKFKKPFDTEIVRK